MFLFSKFRLSWLWIGVTIWMTVLILMGAATYFCTGPTPAFLLEKAHLEASLVWPLWQTALYFHIAGACVCLASGSLLMVTRLVRYSELHALLGYAYVNSVLWVAVPTGLILSPFAKGGFWSAFGFLVTGIAWWAATWIGYATIKRNRMKLHIQWMVRSYAIALSAVSFRIIQFGLAHAIDPELAYTLSVWLSLCVSFWISETCIARQFAIKSTWNLKVHFFQPISKGETV